MAHPLAGLAVPPQMTEQQRAAAAAVVAQQSAAAVAAAQAAAAPPVSDHLKNARGSVDKTVEKEEGDDTQPMEMYALSTLSFG